MTAAPTPDPETRRKVANARRRLARGGERAREQAAWDLCWLRTGDPAAVAALVAALRDPGRGVRLAASAAVSSCPWIAPEHAPALLDFVRPLPDARGDAAHEVQNGVRALGAVADPPPEVAAELGRRVRSPLGNIRDHAAAALRRLGPAAAAALPDLLAAFEEHPSSVLACALAAGGGEGGAVLVRAFRGTSAPHRVAAVEGLKLVPDAAVALLPELRAVLQDPADERRPEVAELVGAIGPAAADAIPDLITLLGGADWGGYTAADLALQKMGPAVVAYVPQVAALLRGPDRDGSHVRAVRLLAHLAGLTADVVEPFREALRMSHPDSGHRRHRGGDSGLVWFGLAGLRAAGHAAAAAVPEVLPLLASEDARNRADAAATLAALGDTPEAVVDGLIRLTRDRESSVRRAALDALGGLRANTPAVLAAVIAAESDLVKNVQARARRARKLIEGRTPKQKSR